MEFDFAAEQPKFLMLMYGLIAFVAVVGGLLLLLDVVPSFFARRREAQLVAASASGAPLPRRRKQREGTFAFFFLLPTLLLLAVGLVVPAIRTTLLSFMDSGSNNWVGLDNYRWMFAEDSIVRVLINTLIWVLLVPLVATGFGLIYAVLVDKARFEAVAKSLIFLPMAISFVGASIIWKFVYAYRGEGDQIGLLNQIVVSLGGEPKQWLLDSPLNTFLLIVIMVWIQAGFAMVVLSAAIKAIPADIVEAARLDGTTPWQMFWRITMPSIRPALIVVVVTLSIATLKVFDIVRTATNGNYDTNVIATEMYNQAFRYQENGQGSALAVFLFVLVIPIVIYQIRNLRKQREG
ncbi:sugar ABC transporter permease [Micromonospora aurantiaca]|uniref:Sugar ABC transporter permease n=1 Tax=Micromonospora aurantiaca (nom. illeg.) TaxID=47850 RepID=A0A1C6TK80_9ACTN|nr:MULTISPECIES: sugar ABC transporter permease [Micromonospora]ADL48550.1 binding-protein-dependent transport systems inner membrane component [Micromonospora aurantiaca ATCC 27029]ADU08785.1 binding-protein-dependent transport systems inner membrane component [Micromonospora sp. L5]AXH88701.1 sugar ABC transporter permease [Micromonospora aurantiaca]MBC9002057.1 sugar ABC transporter permease [Micromonospora aurantiaca]MDG4753851.1 sugar ABC transporter permease [Micromonospora sp. WMMD718]